MNFLTAQEQKVLAVVLVLLLVGMTVKVYRAQSPGNSHRAAVLGK